MFYDVAYYISLTVFFAGVLWRIRSWFTRRVGDVAHEQTTFGRVTGVAKSVVFTLFSKQIVYVIREFFVNVMMQYKILRENTARWIMHMLVFAGFLLLFFLHVIDDTYSHPWIDGYFSTLNPWLFLRNIGAFMVLAGLGIAVYRRLTIQGLRKLTYAMDRYAIAILAIIIVSGVLLEASKIVSHRTFEEMAQTYAHPDIRIADWEDDPELEALMAYWQENYGVVFPERIEPDSEKLEWGADVNDAFACSMCHSRPQAAFLSYATSRAVSPVANAMTNAGAETFFWYVHFLASFIGLAYLPFSKFFHIFSTPIRLLAKVKTGSAPGSLPANIATLRAMELDACMHCANCSLRCSVGPIFETIPNQAILPSEKIGDLKHMVLNQSLPTEELLRIAEGAWICTSCHRCTDVCPAGINLQDLWFSIREELARRGYPEPYVQAMKKALAEAGPDADLPLIPHSPHGKEMKEGLLLSEQASTFTNCYNCMTCTNVCPVVACYDKPSRELGFLPNQIMHALGFGFRDQVLSSRMLWDCVTCYACQEACPQNVRVTDVLYELRNVAYQDVRLEMNDMAAKTTGEGPQTKECPMDSRRT